MVIAKLFVGIVNARQHLMFHAQRFKFFAVIALHIRRAHVLDFVVGATEQNSTVI